MKQVCRSTFARVRVWPTVVLFTLALATRSSDPALRSDPAHIAPNAVAAGQPAQPQTSTIEAKELVGPRAITAQSLFLNTAEQVRVRATFEAAARRDWPKARRLADGTGVALVKKLVEWRYLLDPHGNPAFGELNEFLTANPRWPRRSALLVRAEASLPANADANFVVSWFGRRQPITGFGQIRLGEAEIATGRSADGEARIRRAWVENAFDPATENRILSRHGKLFTPAVQQQRLARMLVNENRAAVRRQLGRLDTPPQLALNARVLLQPYNKLGTLLSTVQPALRDDPRLLMDLWSRSQKEHRPDDARRYLWRAAVSDSALMDRERIWPKLKTAAREAIAEHNYSFAYQLASHNGLQSGAQYVEAEFMAGWLALEHMKEPQTAIRHFEAVRRQATLPATISRAEYWLGRACDALNDKQHAIGHYRLAATKGTTFYGQLANVRLSRAPTLRLKTVNIHPSVAKFSLANDELSKAARILAGVGERDLAREFALRLIEEDPSVNRFSAVIGLAEDLHDPTLSLRVAKEAERKDLLLIKYLHPLVHIPQTAIHAADPAVVLSIIRQESEFDRFAASGAGAHGLMQLLEGTAKEAAERQHIPFNASRLGSDGDYNVQLGEGTFASYMRFWSNSTLLAVASYNAGPGTVKKWVAALGDPRNGHVDPVDWIESIPFDETRTYLQRVLAAAEVYRNRLRSNPGPLTIVADLRGSTVQSSKLDVSGEVQLASK